MPHVPSHNSVLTHSNIHASTTSMKLPPHETTSATLAHATHHLITLYEPTTTRHHSHVSFPDASVTTKMPACTNSKQPNELLIAW